MSVAGPNPAHGLHMPRLDEAQDKLENALTKLESALRERSGAEPELEAELDQTRARCTKLEGETQAVSEQLDAAISRLRALIPS